LKTGGAIPGLSLFEDDEPLESDNTPKTSFWSELKGIFSPPGYVYDGEGEGAVDVGDYHGAGSGWTGERENDQGDIWEGEGFEDEDLVETLVIIGLGAFIMFLFWVRGRYANWDEERRERERRNGQIQDGLQGFPII